MMVSICLDDSLSDTDADWDFPDPDPSGPHTPSEVSDTQETTTDFRPQTYGQGNSDNGSDDDYEETSQGLPRRKKGGYDSRIEQILYENPDLPILITDAGKSLESGGKYIVYTIRTGVGRSDTGWRKMLSLDRTSKFDEDTPNLLHSEMPSPASTLL
jgi:hypothetical protein